VSTWRWIRPDVVFAIHDVQLAQHGGLDGVSDENTVHAALARPEQLDIYGQPPPDAAALAAA
jgi:death-on-curing protein